MGTKKGMVRKTARKAYVKKAGYGKTMKAQRGSKVVKRDTTTSKKPLIKKLQSAQERAMEKLEKKKKVKKAGYGKTMKAKAGLKTPKPSQKGLKKLPTAVRNKMGFAKKGGSTRKCKSGCK